MKRLHWNTLGRRFYLIDRLLDPSSGNIRRRRSRRKARSCEHALEGGCIRHRYRSHRTIFAEWPNAIIVQGARTQTSAIGFGAVAFLHIEINCALPERTALEFFWTGCRRAQPPSQ